MCAHEAGVLVFLNAAPIRPLPAELLAAADYLILNETEDDGVPGVSAGCCSVTAAARALVSDGADNVVLTPGGQGAVLATSGGIMQVPAYPVQVVDSTGAGDAFTGAFASYLAVMRMAPGEALDHACAAGAAACASLGAQSSLPTLDAIQTLRATTRGRPIVAPRSAARTVRSGATPSRAG